MVEDDQQSYCQINKQGTMRNVLCAEKDEFWADALHRSPLLHRLIDISLCEAVKEEDSEEQDSVDDNICLNRFSYALVLVFQAMKGVTDITIRYSQAAVSAYHYHHHCEFIFSFASFILVLLSIFEPPSWCVLQHGFSYCTTIPNSFRTFDLPILNLPILFAVEFALILVVGFEVFLKIFIQGKHFWKLSRNYCLFAVLVLYIIEFMAAVIIAGTGNLGWFRLGPYLRLLIFAIRSWIVRRQLALFVQLLTHFLAVSFVMITIVLIFSLFLVVMVPKSLKAMHKEQRELPFQTVFWKLYVIATTANFDPELEGKVQVYLFYFIFTLIYVTIVILLMYNLLVAVVYKTYMDAQSKQFNYDREQMIIFQQKAWDVLDQRKKGQMLRQDILLLFEEAQKYMYFRKLICPSEYELSLWALDTDNDGTINKGNFNDLIAVFRLRFERLDTPTFMKVWFPTLANTKRFKDFCNFTKGIYFNMIVWFGLLGVVIYTIVNFVIVIGGFEDLSYEHIIEAIIAVFFLLEALIRIVALGWKKYWRLHQFEFWIMLVSLYPILFLFVKILQDASTSTANPVNFVIDFLDIFYDLQIPGIVRIGRIMLTIPWFQKFHKTSTRMVAASFKLVTLLFCFIQFFGLLGCQIFGGQKAEASVTDQTMNDPIGASMNIIELIETQQINDQYHLYAKFSNKQISGIFFAIAFNIIVVICLNLVLSYVIDIFNEEFDRESKEEHLLLEASNYPIQIVGHKVYFRGYCVKGVLGDKHKQGFEGIYCATLHRWTWQRERGAIDQEDELINLFQRKVDLAKEGVF
eukprot:TRINITY_DN6155_c0_g1_i1.p1 TRINITY_DN6155_c0_g1~~TRINITY_DN6155_c0_g1_i1.p1  ORF type:complete len:803 (-),score=48.46 TRINITY_DN6155_c0_g1_i1:1090-3498(-)